MEQGSGKEVENIQQSGAEVRKRSREHTAKWSRVQVEKWRADSKVEPGSGKEVEIRYQSGAKVR